VSGETKKIVAAGGKAAAAALGGRVLVREEAIVSVESISKLFTRRTEQLLPSTGQSVERDYLRGLTGQEPDLSILKLRNGYGFSTKNLGSELPRAMFPPRTAIVSNLSLSDTAGISFRFRSTESKIISDLESHEGPFTKDSIEAIFKTEVDKAFANASGLPESKIKFEALTGNLKIDYHYNIGGIKLTGGAVNVYKISAALGGATYICINSAKYDCMKAGHNDSECKVMEKSVFRNCVDKAMATVDGLVLKQLTQRSSVVVPNSEIVPGDGND
jgi:hypothetical protein